MLLLQPFFSSTHSVILLILASLTSFSCSSSLYIHSLCCSSSLPPLSFILTSIDSLLLILLFHIHFLLHLFTITHSFASSLACFLLQLFTSSLFIHHFHLFFSSVPPLLFLHLFFYLHCFRAHFLF